MSETARGEHWQRLRAERAAARADLVGTLDALEARAKDPFRLKERMRKHPLLFSGIAAGAGALLVKVLLGVRDAAPAPQSPESRSRDDAPDLMETLRDAALRVATPWVTRFVAQHLGERDEADAVGAVNGTQTAHPSD